VKADDTVEDIRLVTVSPSEIGMNNWDAIILGGGPAGAVTAWLLARAGWAVGLVERKVFPRRKVCGEYLSATNLPLLEQLGLAEVFQSLAGPPVRRVGLFAASVCLDTDLPHVGDHWGRALGREHLDTLLLDGAARAGVCIRQPAVARALWREGDASICQARCLRTGADFLWRGRLIVAAHGSWEAGTLPTQPKHRPAQPGDLLGFKAHFQDAGLAEGLMPLLVFPGGYGGLVHSDGGRVTLSCCVRRDRLAALRRQTPSEEAGEAVLAHVLESCLGARRVLEGAKRCGPWLAAGPIRPGIRLPGRMGIFAVGNAAGEAHPVVAEGISMALQGAELLARLLIAWRKTGGRQETLAGMQEAYARGWRQRFEPRLRFSSAVAHWAMRPGPVTWTLPLLRWLPQVLSWGARLSGKVQMTR
jgi:flavin-dependent dehydrogenase